MNCVAPRFPSRCWKFSASWSERVTAAREKIARDRAAAAALRQSIAAEVESLILGTRPVKQA